MLSRKGQRVAFKEKARDRTEDYYTPQGHNSSSDRISIRDIWIPRLFVALNFRMANSHLPVQIRINNYDAYYFEQCARGVIREKLVPMYAWSQFYLEIMPVYNGCILSGRFISTFD